MARIFNGFDALALGQAVNNLHNGMQQQRMTGLQMLGNGIQDFLQNLEDEKREQQRKRSAIDYLTGNGMDEAKASQMVDTITPEQAVLYLTGRLDKQADTEDEREYQELDYLNKRADMLADKRKDKIDDWNDWVSKNNITYGQAAKQAQFGQLMQQLGLISAKDWGDSRQGVDQYNDTINALKKFAEKNDEYMDVLGLINTNLGGGKGDGYFFEDKIKKLMENGGKDITDAQREAILEDLENHGEFSNIIGDPRYTDAIAKFTENVDNKNLMPYIRLQKLIGRNTTQKQRNKQIQNNDFNTRINNLKKQIIDAYKGKGQFPKLNNEQELTALKEVFKMNPRILKHYTK